MPLPTLPLRDAWLEIDLGAIRHNVAVIRALVAPAAVAPVVKADAYGHGLEPVARALADDVEALCVATLDEALRLRGLVPGRVLLLYPVPRDAAAEAVHAGVELTVMSPADLAALQAVARADALPVGLQLCVESGMHRGGLARDELVPVAQAAAADPRFEIRGLWSHLATPEDPISARAQVAAFEAAAAALVAAGLPVPPRHLAASEGIFTHDAPSYEMVRPGLSIYGVLDEHLPLATDATDAAAALRPALSLKARAVAFSEVPVGGTVGYGDTWTAERPTRVAILPVGYGDGYLRGAQPHAYALCGGERRPLVGRVSMDAVAADVTDAPGIDRDDEFVLLGRQGPETIGAGLVARWRNTIAWEVLSSMAPRVARVYYPSAGSDHPV